MVALGLAVTLSVVALDHLMVGRLSLFFDLCFITLCLGLAVRVAGEALFVMSLLPPFLMLAVFTLLGAVAPEMIAEPDDGMVQSLVSGLAHHSTALLVGYGLALVTLAAPATSLLEARRVAGADPEHLGVALRPVDHGGRLGRRLARLDHDVDLVVQLLLDVPAQRPRARSRRGGSACW